MNRRDIIKQLGLGVIGSTVALESLSAKDFNPQNISYAKGASLSSLKTAITCGAGSRGNTYGGYANKFPEELSIIGVAEPVDIRRERYSEKHNIPKANQFVTWEEVFKRPKFADFIIITTPDDLHYGPAMAALSMGYDLLLEKPIAQTFEECADILDLQQKSKAIVAICHVLRYAPYYKKVKDVMESGVLGKIISMQHFEPIEHVHMAHSFVRGNWRKAAETNPIILAKSCHDMDIMRWWIGKRPTHISSFGALSWFKPENAPEGSTKRCTDGCAVERTCPYSAKRIYFDRRHWTYVFDLPVEKEKQGEAIMEYISSGPYGRCVYHCDNDVNDHQVIAMRFEDDVTATFNMEAFTDYGGRRTRIMGSMGCLVGDESDLYISDFSNRSVDHWITKDHASDLSGHGGGDMSLMHDFLRAIDKRDESLLSSTLSASMDSHYMAFKAEESRINYETMSLIVH